MQKIKAQKLPRTNSRYSIRKAFGRVPGDDQPVVRKKILDVFGRYSRPFWTSILYGRKPLNIDQMEALEKIFAELKPPVKRIWGQK